MQLLFVYGSKDIKVVVDADSTPWFVAEDIAFTLGYRTVNEMTKRLSRDYVKVIDVFYLYYEERTAINLNGLLEILDSTDHSHDINFKRWVIDVLITSTCNAVINNPSQCPCNTFVSLVKSFNDSYNQLGFSSVLKLYLFRQLQRHYDAGQGIQKEAFDDNSVAEARVTKSLSQLLREDDCTYPVNEVFLDLQYYGFVERRSFTSGTKVKKCWVITERGLDYGVNIPHGSSGETRPEWYEDSFSDLLREIGI